MKSILSLAGVLAMAMSFSALAFAEPDLQVRPNGGNTGVVGPNVTTPNNAIRSKSIKPGVQKKPDLIPQVINGQHGEVVVKNIGLATAGESQLGIICSRSHSSLTAMACVDERLHLSNYNASYNTLSFNIPALKPGASYRIKVWGAGGIPLSSKVADSYSMKLFADVKKRVAESNERNNDTRLDVTIRNLSQMDSSDFVEKGCSGGITGGGGKIIIHRNGKVFSQGISMGKLPKANEIGSVGTAANQLFEASERMSFLTIQYDHPHSWTCFIGARLAGQYHRVTLDNQTPKSVRTLSNLFISMTTPLIRKQPQ